MLQLNLVEIFKNIYIYIIYKVIITRFTSPNVMMIARVNVWGYEVDVVMMILRGVVLFWGMVVLRLCKTLWIIHRGGISVLRPGIATITSLFERYSSC